MAMPTDATYESPLLLCAGRRVVSWEISSRMERARRRNFTDRECLIELLPVDPVRALELRCRFEEA